MKSNNYPNKNYVSIIIYSITKNNNSIQIKVKYLYLYCNSCVSFYLNHYSDYYSKKIEITCKVTVKSKVSVKSML